MQIQVQLRCAIHLNERSFEVCISVIEKSDSVNLILNKILSII